MRQVQKRTDFGRSGTQMTFYGLIISIKQRKQE